MAALRLRYSTVLFFLRWDSDSGSVVCPAFVSKPARRVPKQGDCTALSGKRLLGRQLGFSQVGCAVARDFFGGDKNFELVAAATAVVALCLLQDECRPVFSGCHTEQAAEEERL